MLKAGICTALKKETLQRFRDAGIVSVLDFLLRDPEQLAQELHVAYQDVGSIRRVLLAEYSSYPVSAARLYQTTQASLTILPTGNHSLDQLLDGGLYTGELTQIAGDSTAGKTQICMWCTSSVVQTDGQSVVYIDTSSGFSAQSLVSLLSEDLSTLTQVESMETLLQSCLSRIRYIESHDVFHLIAALDMLETTLKKQSLARSPRVKLIVIDNIASVIYPVLGGQAGRSQGLLSQIGLKLKQLAAHFSLAVLVTNNMTCSYNGSIKKAALGKVWSHAAQTSLFIRPWSPPSTAASTLSTASPPDNGFREVYLTKSSRQQTPAQTVVSLSRVSATSKCNMGSQM